MSFRSRGLGPVRCDSHGTKPWQGHIVCAVCKRKFSTHDPALSTHAPDVCPCGARLQPGAGKFSARVCCPDCFADDRKGKPAGPLQ